MKKSLMFALSLMMLAAFAVGCTDNDDMAEVTPTVAAAPTVETDDGNVTDDATTDQANDEASDTLTDDMNETIDGTDANATDEPAAETTDEATEG